MPPASATSARLRLHAEGLASLAACARVGADQVRLLYPEVGDPRVQGALERVLDHLHAVLSAVDVAATELTDDLTVLAGGAGAGTGVNPDVSTREVGRSAPHDAVVR